MSPEGAAEGARRSVDLAGQAVSPKSEMTRPVYTVLQDSIRLLSLYVV